MKTIAAIIEKTVDGYSVYAKNEMFSGIGITSEETKADMQKQITFYVQTCKEERMTYPSYLDNDFEIVYKFDVESLLKYYEGVFTIAVLEKLTGINQKQLWAYAHGKSKPCKPQIEKIQNALHALGRELIALSL